MIKGTGEITTENASRGGNLIQKLYGAQRIAQAAEPRAILWKFLSSYAELTLEDLVIGYSIGRNSPQRTTGASDHFVNAPQRPRSVPTIPLNHEGR